MAAVYNSTPGHRGWENWDHDDLGEWIGRTELRDERNRRRQDD
jgi:hypothetical protein